MTTLGPRDPGQDPDDLGRIGDARGVDEFEGLEDPDDEDFALDLMIHAAGSELLDHIRDRMRMPDRPPAEAPAPPAPARPAPPAQASVPPSRLPSRTRPRAPRRPAVPDGHRPGRDAFWTIVADEAFRLGTELIVQLTAAIDLALDLEAAVPDDESLALVRALARGLVGNLATARTFEPGDARASLLAFACDGPIVPERSEAARITGRSRLLTFSVAASDRLIRELTETPTPRTALARLLAQNLARTIGRAQGLQSTLGIVRNGEGIGAIDVSDLNLSRARLHALDVPVGTLWSDATVWPPGVGPRIRSVSRRVGGHVYRVKARDD